MFLKWSCSEVESPTGLAAEEQHLCHLGVYCSWFHTSEPWVPSPRSREPQLCGSARQLPVVTHCTCSGANMPCVARRRLDTAPAQGAAAAPALEARPASAGAAPGGGDSGDMSDADGLGNSIMSMLQLGEAGEGQPSVAVNRTCLALCCTPGALVFCHVSSRRLPMHLEPRCVPEASCDSESTPSMCEPDMRGPVSSMRETSIRHENGYLS